MHAPVILGLLLFSQVISIIRGSIDDHGFCHQQQLKATFCVHCGSSFPDFIAVSIVAGENDPNGAYQLFCLTSQWICSGSMTRTYNATSDTLDIGFIFNHTIHADRYLRIIRDRNGSQENQQILLKPCFSEFTTNASFFNESLITVSCQHSSFNYSNSPIRIKIENGTEYGACSKMGCIGCKRLPDGIQCLVPYIPGKPIQCLLDGAIYNISSPDIAKTSLTPEIAETISTTPQDTSYTSKDTAYTTQSTSYTAQDIKLSTASHENLNIITSTSTENSTPLQSVTTIPQSSSISQKIITTTSQRFSLSHNLTTTLTDGSPTSKSITSPDNLPDSLNITTTSLNSLSTEQEIATSIEGSSTSKSITSIDNLPGSLNLTTTTPGNVSSEQGIAMSTEGSNASQYNNGTTAVEKGTTAYFGTTVKLTNAPSNEIMILNQNIIDQGFCHQQDVNIQLYLYCGIPLSATINVAIVASKHEINPNTILTCLRSNDSPWYCHGSDIMTGYFNASSGLFDIHFRFNFTIHAGHYVRLISSCEGNQETKHAHLTPCLSGFTVNATLYNETSLIINCQHSSFNYSSSPIRIKLKGGNDLGACSKISCHICKMLPDGIQCDVLYVPEHIYQCVLDGAIISLPTTALEVQTITPQNVSTSQRVTTSSENTPVSEESTVISTDSSTTSPRSITSSEGSTTLNLITKAPTEDTTLQYIESTLPESIQTTFSESYSTSGSTTSMSEETSTAQTDIVVSSESSTTSRENTESTTNVPYFQTTPVQSTQMTTTQRSGATITIINKDVFDGGFCHINDVDIQLILGCKSHVCAIVELSIVSGVDDTYADNFMTCLRFSDVMWNCHDNGIMTGKYNASSNALGVRFNFNYTRYAGRYLRIKSSCVGDQDITHVLLKACFSEFNVQSTFYNETSLMINCQHSSFNYSSSLIRIKLEGGDDYGSCSKTTCNSCKRLSDGIQCIVPFTPGKKIQCILDGAVYNISIPANHVTQTALPGTSLTSEKTTTISPYRSSSSQSMTSMVFEGSTTTTTSLTSPEKLSTEQRISTSLTNSTTEQTYWPTEPESPVTSPNTKPMSPDILSTSQNISTTSPSNPITSPNTIPTSPSIFLTSQRNTMITTTLHETQTSRGSTLIPTTQSSSDHSIIIINEDVLDQGFCNLNGVNINLRVTCKIQYFATLNFSVVANEYETNETIFLSCVRSIDATWICQGFGSMTGKYNKSFDLLEIALNLNYTVYAGHYLRTISSCDNIRDTKHIQLKACFSGFTVNTDLYNDSFINVRCQHSSYNYSNSQIRIKIDGGNDYGACSRNSCNGCKRLPNGIECKVPYIPGEQLQCILDGAIYNIPAQNMTSPGITTTILQIITTQHIKTTPQISSTTYTGNSTESLTKTKWTSTKSPESSSTPQNTPITSDERQTSMKSIPTSTSHANITTTIIQATSKESITITTSIPPTSKESKTTSSTTIPTTFQESITSTHIPTSSQESITQTTDFPRTSQESIRTTTIIPATFKEILTTKSIPITSQESITKTAGTQTTPQENVTTAYIPTTSKEGETTTTSIPITSLESITKTSISTSQERTTPTTNMPTTSQNSRTTTTDILTKSLESITTTANISTNSQESITTITSIPKTSEVSITTPWILIPESITTTNIHTTSQEDILLTNISTTSQKSITTKNIPKTSQETKTTTANIHTTSLENITTTTIIPTTSQESMKTTTIIPTTSQDGITTLQIPTTTQENITTTNISTSSKENEATPRIPTTSQETITTTNIPTTSLQSKTTATNIPTTSQEILTTKTSVQTTSQESIITTTNIPTTSQRAITTMTSITTPSPESITTSNILTTRHESTTSIQTTFQESTTTTTTSNPPTQSIIMSSKTSSETPQGSIKSTTPAEITYDSSENLSRRPTTKLTQSSTYGSLNADLANDGILNTVEKYCAHTAISYTKAWLQVALGKMFSINNVKIYYRNAVVTGWKQYRFRQFHLDVSILRATETTAVERTRCYTDNTTAPYLPSTTIDIPCKETARYVIVETTYDAPEDDPITGAVLEICEIEVYGCEVGQYGDYCKCCEGCQECDIENGKCAVKHPELSSQSHDQSCDQSILYGVILAFCFSLVFNIIFIIWSFRNKECREKGQEKDVNSSGQTSTNAPSTDPVLYKIGEDNEGYQELRVT